MKKYPYVAHPTLLRFTNPVRQTAACPFSPTSVFVSSGWAGGALRQIPASQAKTEAPPAQHVTPSLWTHPLRPRVIWRGMGSAERTCEAATREECGFWDCNRGQPGRALCLNKTNAIIGSPEAPADHPPCSSSYMADRRPLAYRCVEHLASKVVQGRLMHL